MTADHPGAAGADRAGAVGAVAEPILAAAGYDLEDVVILTPPGRRDVRVVVDRDGGASLDALAELSRTVGDALDAAGTMGDAAYELELTTPGIGRPLTLPRHWRRAVGRKVTVAYQDAGSATTTSARVGPSDDDGVTLVSAVKGRISEVRVPYGAITAAEVDVDFSRPGEAELRACGLDDAEIARRRDRGPAPTD